VCVVVGKRVQRSLQAIPEAIGKGTGKRGEAPRSPQPERREEQVQCNQARSKVRRSAAGGSEGGPQNAGKSAAEQYRKSPASPGGRGEEVELKKSEVRIGFLLWRLGTATAAEKRRDRSSRGVSDESEVRKREFTTG